MNSGLSRERIEEMLERTTSLYVSLSGHMEELGNVRAELVEARSNLATKLAQAFVEGSLYGKNLEERRWRARTMLPDEHALVDSLTAHEARLNGVVDSEQALARGLEITAAMTSEFSEELGDEEEEVVG